MSAYTTLKNIFSKKTALFFVLALCTVRLWAQQTNYISDLPTPEKVKMYVKGKNEADTYAKQASVMEVVYQMIQLTSISRPQATPAEQQYSRAINTFNEELYNKFCTVSNFAPAERNSRVYFNRAKAVYSTNSFEKYVVDNLFGPLAKQQYVANENRIKNIQKANDEASAAREKAFNADEAATATEKRNKTLTDIAIGLGVLIVLIVFGIRLKQLFSGGSGSGRIT